MKGGFNDPPNLGAVVPAMSRDDDFNEGGVQ